MTPAHHPSLSGYTAPYYRMSAAASHARFVSIFNATSNFTSSVNNTFSTLIPTSSGYVPPLTSMPSPILPVPQQPKSKGKSKAAFYVLLALAILLSIFAVHFITWCLRKRTKTQRNARAAQSRSVAAKWKWYNLEKGRSTDASIETERHLVAHLPDTAEFERICTIPLPLDEAHTEGSTSRQFVSKPLNRQRDSLRNLSQLAGKVQLVLGEGMDGGNEANQENEAIESTGATASQERRKVYAHKYLDRNSALTFYSYTKPTLSATTDDAVDLSVGSSSQTAIEDMKEPQEPTKAEQFLRAHRKHTRYSSTKHAVSHFSSDSSDFSEPAVGETKQRPKSVEPQNNLRFYTHANIHLSPGDEVHHASRTSAVTISSSTDENLRALNAVGYDPVSDFEREEARASALGGLEGQ